MKDHMFEWLKAGHTTLPNILLTSYKHLNLSEIELILLIQVYSFIEKGNDFPTPSEIANRMTISSSQASEMLRRLIQKGLLEIIEDTSSEGIRFERYSLNPLWEKVFDNMLTKEKKVTDENSKTEEVDLYTCFEQEFGRPLSPFECETLSLWLDDDQHDSIIIKAALKEAVISGKLNFRYIDRILFEWKKNGIKTVEQAKHYGQKFRSTQIQQRQNMPQEVKKTEQIHFYNWLEQ